MTHRVRPDTSMWARMAEEKKRPKPPDDPPWFGKTLLYVVEKPPTFREDGRMVAESRPCAVYDNLDAVIEAMHAIKGARVFILRLNEPTR